MYFFQIHLFIRNEKSTYFVGKIFSVSNVEDLTLTFVNESGNREMKRYDGVVGVECM